MMSLMDLLPSPPAEIVSGEISIDGEDVCAMSVNQMRGLRGGKVGFIFQNPMTSLNPVYSVGFQLMEPWREHLGLSKTQARVRATELLKLVGIPDAEQRLRDYPHQFYGGMRQRVMIAIALSCDPKVLIADEPTTALDVTIQAQILELVRELRQKMGMVIIWITHNLGVIAGIADRVAAMYAGQIVEHAEVKELFRNPQYLYTRALLETLPKAEGERDVRLRSIDGQPPNMTAAPTSCEFAPRCGHAFERCWAENPQRVSVGNGHDVACWWDANSGGRAMLDDNSPLVRVENLKMHFPIYRGILSRQVGAVKAVDEISFHIQKGETFGLVGESGCGKSTVGRALLLLYDITEGAIEVNGHDISTIEGEELRNLRAEVQMIFQDPQASFNSRMTVGSIIAEPLDEHTKLTKKEKRAKVAELMDSVGPARRFADRYPHEFSGGQRQRIGIARALALSPKFIVCDEPIAALDVSIQAQVVNLLEDLQEQLGLTYLFISHDPSMIRHLATRVVVMYLGKIVELAPRDALFDAPLHL